MNSTSKNGTSKNSTPKRKEETRNAETRRAESHNAPAQPVQPGLIEWPHSDESEAATLGAMIIDTQAAMIARGILVGADFYRPRHVKIFDAVLRLLDKTVEVDLVTVTEELRLTGELEASGGPAYLSACIEGCPSSAKIETYATTVLELANKRQSAVKAIELQSKSLNGATTADLIALFQDAVEAMKGRSTDRHKPVTYKGTELMNENLPEPEWIIPQLLPFGLTLFAGKPKVGKSWMALNIALSVASGGRAIGDIEVRKGRVLYLALEDTKRRLQRRCELSLAGSAMPEGFEYALSWPRLDVGGVARIEKWIEANPDARLVIIDTFKKVRPQRKANGDIYGEDYNDAEALKAIADKYGVAVLVLHHLNKTVYEDVFDSVNGTLGLTGGADSSWVILRRRASQDAELHTTGRDIDETVYALTFDRNIMSWVMVGDNEEVKLSKERQEVLDLIEEYGEMSIKDIAALLDKSYNTVKKLLWTMAKDGQLYKDSSQAEKYSLIASNLSNRVTGETAVSNAGEKRPEPEPAKAPFSRSVPPVQPLDLEHREQVVTTGTPDFPMTMVTQVTEVTGNQQENSAVTSAESAEVEKIPNIPDVPEDQDPFGA